MAKSSDHNIVYERNFILATRSTGYRSTAAAVAELIDNSLQAGATKVQIFIEQDGIGTERKVRLSVLDNGRGMDAVTLRTALRFGGSSRFDDRTGPGRFGMGLPNASVSQARRFEVYTWKSRNKVIKSYLDVDEISAGSISTIPAPKAATLPAFAKPNASKSGTLVMWDKCDQLDNRKAATIAEKLVAPVGRQFRYFIWKGIVITINGTVVKAVDPLFLKGTTLGAKASQFGEPLEYEFRIPTASSKTSKVRVRFSELPINEWHSLEVEDKRRIGVTKGAGVSIVRAGREIDVGWYFLGDKRKENYDDWWRCEVCFEPELDEYFGVTHSKQTINPSDELKNSLSPDLEAIAHALNSRVRAAYMLVRANEVQGLGAVRAASEAEAHLTPIPVGGAEKSNGSSASKRSLSAQRRKLQYATTIQKLSSPEFFVHGKDSGGRVLLTINANHPFFEHCYERLKAKEAYDEIFVLECMLLAAARADLAAPNRGQRRVVAEFRKSWSNALAAFLDR